MLSAADVVRCRKEGAETTCGASACDDGGSGAGRVVRKPAFFLGGSSLGCTAGVSLKALASNGQSNSKMEGINMCNLSFLAAL